MFYNFTRVDITNNVLVCMQSRVPFMLKVYKKWCFFLVASFRHKFLCQPI